MHRMNHVLAALLASGLFIGSGAAFAQNTGATVTPVGNGTVATTALPANTGAAPGTASGAVVHGTAGTASTITPPPAAATPGQVVVGGKVPDEATKAAVLQKLRDTYGATNVVDQIEVATSRRRRTGARTCRSCSARSSSRSARGS